MGQGAHISTSTEIWISTVNPIVNTAFDVSALVTAEGGNSNNGSLSNGTLTIQAAVDASGNYTSSANAVAWVTIGSAMTGVSGSVQFTASSAGTIGFRAQFDPKGEKFESSTSDDLDVTVANGGGGDSGELG
jgi:hypothetical protein